VLRAEQVESKPVGLDAERQRIDRIARPKKSAELAFLPHNPWAVPGVPELGNTVRRITSLCGWTGSRAGAGRTLAVASPREGDGKSTLASAIVISTAYDQAGEVLLVECDLLRPRMGEDFGFGDVPGLADVLAGETNLSSAVQPTSIPNLRVLPAGRLHGNPSRLLRSPVMVELIEEARAAYGFVMLDVPAVLKSSDAPVLARLTEGTVLVVRSGVTGQRELERALRDLSGATIQGVVLNGWRSAIPGVVRAMVDQQVR